jgi:hypothetical protein
MNEFETLIKALDTYISKADDDLTDRLNEEGYLNASETVENINSLEDAIAEILEQELEYFLGEIEGVDLETAINNIMPNLLEGDLTDEKLAEVFKDIFEKALRSLTDSYIKQIDKDLAFSMFSERTSDWIKSWSEELGRIMKLGSHEELERILNKGLENGDSVQQVMEKLMDSYGFSRKRARATAITEMLTAHSYSQEEAIRQSPAVDRKEWKHTGEHKIKPRPHHQAMDGTIVKKNEPFVIYAPTGTYEAMFPRDISLPASERVNCHCVHRAIVNDDIFGLPIEERRKLQQQAIEEDNALWEAELDAKNRAKAGIE